MDATVTVPRAAGQAAVPWIPGEILRDIARGGLTGVIGGMVGAGIGGRLVMRVAALLQPTAVGSFTENGNRIGDITLEGTVSLILLGGFLGMLFLGFIWVVISPWLPGTGVVKGIAAMPIAIALGSFAMIDARNTDFAVLANDPFVVASIIVFIALVPLVMAVVDGLLDKRLPHPASDRSTSTIAYGLLAGIGGLIGVVSLVASTPSANDIAVDVIVIGVGIVTAIWWNMRLRGEAKPPRTLVVAARSILVVGTVIGFIALIPEVRGVLGAS